MLPTVLAKGQAYGRVGRLAKEAAADSLWIFRWQVGRPGLITKPR